MQCRCFCSGDITSLVPKLHGLSLESFGQLLGVRCQKVDGVEDQSLGPEVGCLKPRKQWVGVTGMSNSSWTRVNPNWQSACVLFFPTTWASCLETRVLVAWNMWHKRSHVSFSNPNYSEVVDFQKSIHFFRQFFQQFFQQFPVRLVGPLRPAALPLPRRRPRDAAAPHGDRRGLGPGAALRAALHLCQGHGVLEKVWGFSECEDNNSITLTINMLEKPHWNELLWNV